MLELRLGGIGELEAPGDFIMASKQARHLRLDILARELLASPSKLWVAHMVCVPSDHEALLTVLRKERLALDDFAFRKRYAAWL